MKQFMVDNLDNLEIRGNWLITYLCASVFFSEIIHSLCLVPLNNNYLMHTIYASALSHFVDPTTMWDLHALREMMYIWDAWDTFAEPCRQVPKPSNIWNLTSNIRQQFSNSCHFILFCLCLFFKSCNFIFICNLCGTCLFNIDQVRSSVGNFLIDLSGNILINVWPWLYMSWSIDQWMALTYSVCQSVRHCLFLCFPCSDLIIICSHLWIMMVFFFFRLSFGKSWWTEVGVSVIVFSYVSC